MSEKRQDDEHRSYGMIGINHISSSGTHLVGSDFHHHHFVALRIHRARKHREASRDWWSAANELIEVYLTESQLVELIGRPNMGDGIPCTLSRIAGENQPDPPKPEDRKTQGHKDLSETAAQMQTAMKEMLAVVETGIFEGKVGKKALEKMAFSLRCQIENFAPNMNFVVNSFDKAMDETINRAGVEIEATVAQTAIRLGISEMQKLAGEGPKLIEAKERETK